MPLTSDIVIDASKFAASSVTEETKKLNKLLEKVAATGPRWHEVGIAKYREMREVGETTLPVPVYLPEAKNTSIPSREKGRNIPLRVYSPDNGESSKGIFLHSHGGGFVMGTHQQSDDILKRYANECQLTAISVGYRLAPENPHPAPLEDCFDAAEYLVDHGPAEYGGKLLFVGGESVGATLSLQTAFHLLRARPDHVLSGVIALYGYFDFTNNLPQASSFHKVLVINSEALNRTKDAYAPGKDMAELRHPLVSPLYEDMKAFKQAGKSLPPAIFLCGTEDPLLDDTLLMSMKWLMSGSEAIVKIYPGAPHAFTVMAGAKVAEEGCTAVLSFIQEKLT